ncbi:Sugar phosphate isomerase/epimerase [Paracoccus halophilus]|uniref:Sugar phosphate isomerase n=1 Tax=Paracoccus halophilus TaxID=376733 RepID=A0A099EVQ8_9RHOB|nr:sugar phosphate isomerase/epimerase family protein [Paracoccus halophilus]KGJ02091.1 sugar phosphate isomerase [Paracoccus halophilus]SFA61411.1 Sugar phosphate isomerase/epimerase [Paracoccus halophilus]
MTIKLAMHTWPYASNPRWLPAYTLEETLRRIKEIGYDAVEIGAASPHVFPQALSDARRKEIAAMLRDYELTLCAMLPAHGGGPGNNVASPVPEEREWAINHYKEMVKLTADWGGNRLICLPGWTIFGTSAHQGWDWAQQAILEIARHAQDFGVEIIIEPTPEDSNIVNTCDDTIQMMKDVGESNVKLMFDTHHVITLGEVMTDYVHAMGGDLVHLHLSDNERLPPGQGIGDFPALIKALKQIDFDGYLSMECGWTKTGLSPDWVARTSLEYTKPLVDAVN